MRKLFLATTALVALAAGSAAAADLPVAYKAPPPVRPACANFGGFYVGANGGWAYHDKSWVDRDAWVDNFSNDWALGTVNSSRNGGTVGLQAGYNWQSGCTMFGVEIDGNWTGINNSKYYSPTAAPGTSLTLDDGVKWFGTARTRTGVIVDNLLLYVTGGVAYANIKHDFTVTDPNVPAVEAFSASKSRWGWVGGLGAEWAWTQNVSIKSEVLYIRFNELTTTGFSANGAQTVNFDHQDSMWVTRIGLNVKFGAPRAY